MGALVIMLIIALIPTGYMPLGSSNLRFSSSFTGNLNQSFNSSLNFDAACYFSETYRKSLPNESSAGLSYMEKNLSFQYMVLSVFLLGLGMITRLTRLFATPSRLLHFARASVRWRAKRIFSAVLKYCEDAPLGSRLVVSVAFVPCWAIFVVLSSLTDLWSSMAFEVCRIHRTLIYRVELMHLNRSGGFLSASAGGFCGYGALFRAFVKSDPDARLWTFGQVTPVVALAAPLIMMYEGWQEGQKTSRFNIYYYLTGKF